MPGPFPRISRTRVIAIAAIAVVVWGAWHFWPDEERRVRRRLAALDEVLNERSSDGLAIVTRTAQLASFITDDIVLEPGRGAGAIRGRERLLALASRAPSSGAAFRITFEDVSVRVDGDQAVAHLSAVLTTGDPRTGDESVDAREFELTWRKTDDWRIARVVAINPMERPQ